MTDGFNQTLINTAWTANIEYQLLATNSEQSRS